MSIIASSRLSICWRSYREEVAALAQKHYGLTLDDLVSEEQLLDGWKGDESSLELIERLSKKYDLVRVDNTRG